MLRGSRNHRGFGKRTRFAQPTLARRKETLRRRRVQGLSGLMVWLSYSKPTAYFAIRGSLAHRAAPDDLPGLSQALLSILEALVASGEAFYAAVRLPQQTFRQPARIIAHSLAKVTQNLRPLPKSRQETEVRGAARRAETGLAPSLPSTDWRMPRDRR